MKVQGCSGSALLALAIGCGAASGDDSTTNAASSSSSEPTTSEPTTNEPTTNEPTTNEPTTGEPTTSGGPDTETGGEACEDGDAQVAFTIDVGDLPLEDLSGSEETGQRAIVECTVDGATTADTITLDCTGTDDAQHAVVISISAGAPAASAFVADATVTLTYERWSELFVNCAFGDDEDSVWLTVHDADGLLLAGVRAGSLVPYGGDEVAAYAPFTVAFDDGCAGMPTGDTGGVCLDRLLGVAVSTADDPGDVVLAHHIADVAGAHVAVGFAQESIFDPETIDECCIEGGRFGLELVMARLPP